MKKYTIMLMFVWLGVSAFGSTVEVSMENDFLGGTDRHYTHGTRITHSYSITSDMFPDKNISRRWAIGQYMYTPSEIDVETIQIGDRPYGGWLYGATSISVYDNNTLDFLEIDVGLTGKWSGAGDTQKKIHEWLDATEPKGWDTQLDERVGVNMSYITKFKVRTDNLDVVAKGSLTGGNIHLNAGVGMLLRLGYNIPDDFGVIRMEPVSRALADFGIYGIMELSSKFVGYNYFLEGNDTEDIYNINMERYVFEGSIGFGTYYKNLDFIYLYNIRTKEFKEQADNNEFGTVAFSWSY